MIQRNTPKYISMFKGTKFSPSGFSIHYECIYTSELDLKSKIILNILNTS